MLVVLCAAVGWLVSTSSPGIKEGIDSSQGSADQASLRENRKRAEQGEIPAQIELAENYCEGKGVSRNRFQCADWYRKAANRGSGIAMLRLGDMYATGEGFILDKDAAIMWWRKAGSTADGAEGAARRLPANQAAPGR